MNTNLRRRIARVVHGPESREVAAMMDSLEAMRRDPGIVAQWREVAVEVARSNRRLFVPFLAVAWAFVAAMVYALPGAAERWWLLVVPMVIISVVTWRTLCVPRL